MKKTITTVMILTFILLITACNQNNNSEKENIKALPGNKPPPFSVIVDDEQYDTVLGSYCWETEINKAECVDVSSSTELLKNILPIQVSANELVVLHLDYLPKPNDVHLFQAETNEEIEMHPNNFSFSAPEEKGVYYYYFTVWWLDEENDNVSLGSADYFFSIEVT